MLKHLSVSNYALISSLSIDFERGFTTITGETGAGKSILIGALGFALGNRADSNILINDTKKCVVEAIFNLDDETLRLFFDENDIDFEKECIIRRELSTQKKSRAFINDTPVSIQTLKELGTKLVDIHSQHDSLLLCNPEFQLALLDDAAENQECLSEYQKVFKSYSITRNELLKLRQKSVDNLNENDFLKFQLDEIMKANLLDNEYDELSQRIEVLENQEEINRLLAESLSVLENDEQSLLDGVNTLLHNVDKLRRFLPDTESMAERLNTIKIELKDICSDMQNMQDDSSDVSSLESLQQRFDLIQHLMMKHHLNEYSHLLQLRSDIKNKVDEFSNIDETLSEKENELKSLEKLLYAKAKELNRRRLDAKSMFEKNVTDVIRQLAMPHAVFEISCKQIEELSSTGMNEVCFMFSANKGITPDNMAKAASGGELSRLMLAIKSVASQSNYIPTLIFDEIDTGVSGEVASKLSDIMKKMGESIQIVSITHLPQIASKAQHHFFVYKEELDDKTYSNIKKLSHQERVVEIAKMLSNDEITEEALKAAEVLVAQ